MDEDDELEIVLGLLSLSFACEELEHFTGFSRAFWLYELRSRATEFYERSTDGDIEKAISNIFRD